MCCNSLGYFIKLHLTTLHLVTKRPVSYLVNAKSHSIFLLLELRGTLCTYILRNVNRSDRSNCILEYDFTQLHQFDIGTEEHAHFSLVPLIDGFKKLERLSLENWTIEIPIVYICSRRCVTALRLVRRQLFQLCS